MSVVNVGEVFYRLSRTRGPDQAAAFRQAVEDNHFPVTWVPATNARIWAAAAMKAHHTLSYADAFAVALALEFSAPVVTGDPEIVALRSRCARRAAGPVNVRGRTRDCQEGRAISWSLTWASRFQ